MSSKKEIKLDCGVVAEAFTTSKYEMLRISLIDLYNGYGALSNLRLLASLFNELADKGYTSDGISRVEGYYDSTDDLLLDVSRKKQKQ
jgi:hypothetical protein